MCIFGSSSNPTYVTPDPKTDEDREWDATPRGAGHERPPQDPDASKKNPDEDIQGREGGY